MPVQEKDEGRVEKGVDDVIAHVEVVEKLKLAPLEVHEAQGQGVQQDFLQLLPFVIVNDIVFLEYVEDFQEEGWNTRITRGC